jgi:hypothetical protein
VGHGGRQIAKALPRARACLDEQVFSLVDRAFDGCRHLELTWPFRPTDARDGRMQDASREIVVVRTGHSITLTGGYDSSANSAASA